MEAGRLACWGPLEENCGARDDAFALSVFSSMVSGVLGTRGLKVKADANSLVVCPLLGSWFTSFSQLGAAVGIKRGSS